MIDAGATYHDGPRTLTDAYRAPGTDTVSSQLELKWSFGEESVSRYLRTYGKTVVTEHATLCLAAILVEHRASLQITEVINFGGRADYWLGDKELVLEVSGQQEGSLPSLLKSKVKQLRENPYQRDGYVCVANYHTRQAHLSFCQFED